MLITFIRSLIIYVVIIVSMRLMGKRQIGELQPSELVITILISNIATLPIEDNNVPVALGIIPVLVLVGCELLMSNITLRFKRMRTVVSGKPVIIIEKGVIDQAELKKLRFSIDDLMESLRQQNIFDVNEVEYAVVETTGKVSVLQKFPYQTVTPDMMKLTGKNPMPPIVVISDGQIIYTALSKLKITEEWVVTQLNEKQVDEVFIMTVTYDKQVNLIMKQQVK